MNRWLYRTVTRLSLLTLALFLAVSGFYWAVTAGVQRYLDKNPLQVIDPYTIAKPMDRKNAATMGHADAARRSGPAEKSGQQVKRPGRHPIETDLLLMGTVAGSPSASFAIIKDKSVGSQGLYRLGQAIRGGTIAEILREKVVIVIGDRRFVLAAQDHEGQEPVEKQGAIGIATGDIREALDHMEQALAQIDFQPYSTDGGKGLEITSVAPGSIFDRFGLRRGDIIQRVNNVPIENPQLFADLFAQMKSFPVSLSFDNLDEEAVGVLTQFNPAAKGIGNQLASMVKKMKSGKDVPLEFIRGGEVRRESYRMD